MRQDTKLVSSINVRCVVSAALLLSAAFGSECWAQEQLFISNYGGNTIGVFPRTVNGDVTPTYSIFDSLQGPHQIAPNSGARELIVVNNLDYSVTVYDSATGTLKRRISGPHTGLTRPTGLAVDQRNQELYVTNDWGNSVTVYPLSANGDITPVRKIEGFSTGLSSPVGIAVDLVNGEILVANYGAAYGGSITTYPRTANGNTPPIRTIQGPATGFNLPQGLALDFLRDEIVVANSAFRTPNAGAIFAFKRTATGDTPPVRVLSGSDTRLCNPIGLTLDLVNDELTVANSNFANGTCEQSVTTYARTASGNAAPLRSLVGSGHLSGLYNPASVATKTDKCPAGPIGNINLGLLPQYLFFFANGSEDANWDGANSLGLLSLLLPGSETKGFVGDVVVDGKVARERTSSNVPYAGTISTSDTTLGAWQRIVDQNAGQAFGRTGYGDLVANLKSSLTTAMAQINGLPATPGFTSRSATSLNGLNTTNGVPETIVINVTSGFQVSSKIYISGDPGDVFVLRWDTDADPSNGYQGEVKFQGGGAIVPLGGLKPSNFIHVAGNLDASGGGSNPPPPYPQGPRLNDGTGPLISGGKDFAGGGFFTGYWLTTGDPVSGNTSAFNNAIFVGGWYTLTDRFSMTSGTSGVRVCPLP
jgi:hypothetical protein